MQRGHVVLLAALVTASPIHAQVTKVRDVKSPYPTMAPIEQYRMARDAEIALARTAAPASISSGARILVLGQKNYETAIEGKNGFVCMVGRAWTGPLNNPEYWNPKNRSPVCLNPPAARSVLPIFIKQAGMVLAGYTKPQIDQGIKDAVDKKELGAPESGSMIYMMSKEAYLTDRGGHNLAHVMFELPTIDAATWGADQADSPIFSASFAPIPMIEFNVPVSQWSDGSEVSAPHM
ncbi:MAG TPA: hypothetical protein VFA43_15785 [Gemmatimonadaceae bacterium]|nr:hypothetical protein [Gemmatimonadaceae bacterium]